VAVLTEVAMQREIAEVQAAMTIAKKFPRDHLQLLIVLPLSVKGRTGGRGFIHLCPRRIGYHRAVNPLG